jgi:hypothetical protein
MQQIGVVASGQQQSLALYLVQLENRAGIHSCLGNMSEVSRPGVTYRDCM